MPTPMQGSDRPLLAVGLLCVATLCFAVMAGLVKSLSVDISVPQIIWGRYFFHILLIVVIFPLKISTILISGRPDLQILRGVLVLGATTCAFTALQYIPMADVAAIGFVGPLLVIAMAASLLHEHVGLRRWIAVGVGFMGVLVILRPGSGIMHWASILPLGMACCYAGYQILTRFNRGAATPLTSLFYTALVGSIATSLVVPFFWQPPDAIQWLTLVGIGLFAAAGHLMVIKAYELAPASIVAPFIYSELLWNVIVGWMIFAEIPDVWMLTGAAILMLSGLYLLRTKAGNHGKTAIRN